MIDAETKTCALLGHPVGHSLSPAIHNAAFEALGLNFLYVAHDVSPGELPRAVDGARVMGYRGLSVTIPHKAAALECVDEADATARGIGCINTVVNDGGRLLGYNSDGLGALGALREAGVDPRGGRVLLLGSGGAARAVAVTLAIEAPPERLRILGVEPEELERLVADVGRSGPGPVTGGELSADSLREEFSRAEIVLQCTPVGMHPETEKSLVPPDFLKKEQVVFDAVYNPRRTRLLRDAEAAGCRTVEGIEMFLGQAAAQFELWTGRKAPTEAMRKVVEKRL